MSSQTGQVPTLPTRGGGAIPQLGFGVFQVPPEETAEVVTRALEAGYRHIDTAAAYRNERGVGEAVRASGRGRDEVYKKTKWWNESQGNDEAPPAMEKSLGRLGMDHVDLYLIHWPVPAHDRYVDTWRAFIAAQEEGLARTIGVSNFQPPHLRRLIEETGQTPAVNQIELHPLLQQGLLRTEHDELGIVTEAWSPLAQGAALGEPAIVEIAARHERTPARFAENFDVFGFELDAAEMDAIAALDRGERTGPDPDTFVRP